MEIAEKLETATKLLQEATGIADEAGIAFTWKGPENRGRFEYDPVSEKGEWDIMDRIQSNWAKECWVNSKGKC